eukprot:6173953-Pleurochrysis_carterae.AAC.1
MPRVKIVYRTETEAVLVSIRPIPPGARIHRCKRGKRETALWIIKVTPCATGINSTHERTAQ